MLAQETVDLTQDAPASLPAALSTQQGDNSVPAKPQGEGDAVLVRDSDDDEDGHPSPRGGPSVPPTSGGRALGVDPPTEGGAQATLEQHTAAGSTAGKGEQAFAETPATPDAAADPATADAANPALPDDRFKVTAEFAGPEFLVCWALQQLQHVGGIASKARDCVQLVFKEA